MKRERFTGKYNHKGYVIVHNYPARGPVSGPGAAHVSGWHIQDHTDWGSFATPTAASRFIDARLNREKKARSVKTTVVGRKIRRG